MLDSIWMFGWIISFFGWMDGCMDLLMGVWCRHPCNDSIANIYDFWRIVYCTWDANLSSPSRKHTHTRQWHWHKWCMITGNMPQDVFVKIWLVPFENFRQWLSLNCSTKRAYWLRCTCLLGFRWTGWVPSRPASFIVVQLVAAYMWAGQAFHAHLFF